MTWAAFLAGVGVGIALTLWAIGRSMSTPEAVPDEVARHQVMLHPLPSWQPSRAYGRN